jgi:hypothetical protein
MSRLNCKTCRGLELIPIVYCNDHLKTLERSWGPCFVCEKHDPIGRHESERVMSQDEADKLLQSGYHYVDASHAKKVA